MPGALEREHLVARRDVDLRDRELPGRHVGQQLEHRVERIGVVVGADRREQEDLGVELARAPASSSSSSRTSTTASSMAVLVLVVGPDA